MSNYDIMQYAQQAIADSYHRLSALLDKTEADGRTDAKLLQEFERVAEQYDEINDYLDSYRRSHRDADLGKVGDVTRLKVEDKYGSWYYQKVESYNEEEERKEHVYNLYDSDGSFVDEFGNVTAMKHYVRTGRRL